MDPDLCTWFRVLHRNLALITIPQDRVAISHTITCWSTPTASSPSYMMVTQPSLHDSTNKDIRAWIGNTNIQKGNKCNISLVMNISSTMMYCTCNSVSLWYGEAVSTGSACTALREDNNIMKCVTGLTSGENFFQLNSEFSFLTWYKWIKLCFN